MNSSGDRYKVGADVAGRKRVWSREHRVIISETASRRRENECPWSADCTRLTSPIAPSVNEALPIPDELRRGKMEETLVCSITAWVKDDEDVGGVAPAAVQEIEDVAETVKTRRIVVYPYAHLSLSLAKAAPARLLRHLFDRRLEDVQARVQDLP